MPQFLHQQPPNIRNFSHHRISHNSWRHIRPISSQSFLLIMIHASMRPLVWLRCITYSLKSKIVPIINKKDVSILSVRLFVRRSLSLTLVNRVETAKLIIKLSITCHRRQDAITNNHKSIHDPSLNVLNRLYWIQALTGRGHLMSRKLGIHKQVIISPMNAARYRHG